MLTQGGLLRLWKKYNFKPNKRLGQSFLIDRNIKDKIIEKVAPDAHDEILEIGPGFLELTLDLARKAKKVTALEKDRRIIHILKEELLNKADNVQLVSADFLEYTPIKYFNKIVGNIPYSITTPIIEKLLKERFKAIKGMFIMVQREYADRMEASPRTKAYSPLSCFVQFNLEVKRLLSISRNSFFPVPKHDSVFLRLNYLERPRIKITDEDIFFKIIRGAFQQRRKRLINALAKRPLLGIDKEMLSRIVEEIGMDKNARAEDLSLEEFGKLADRVALWKQKR